MKSRIDSCEFDLGIKCVNDTGCVQCIRSDNKWESKWIQYISEDSPIEIGMKTPVIELEN